VSLFNTELTLQVKAFLLAIVVFVKDGKRQVTAFWQEEGGNLTSFFFSFLSFFSFSSWTL